MIIELSQSAILNLTKDDELDGSKLLNIAILNANLFDLEQWRIRPISSQEANHVYDPMYSDNERGLSLLDKVIVAPVPENYDYIFHANNPQLQKYIDDVKSFLINKDPSFSSTHFMDESGFIDWHTNKGESPLKPYRLYVTHNTLEGSVFKYIDREANEVVTVVEPVGWYAKLFNTDENIVHCVKSNGNRYSIGIRF